MERPEFDANETQSITEPGKSETFNRALQRVVADYHVGVGS